MRINLMSNLMWVICWFDLCPFDVETCMCVKMWRMEDGIAFVNSIEGSKEGAMERVTRCALLHICVCRLTYVERRKELKKLCCVKLCSPWICCYYLYPVKIPHQTHFLPLKSFSMPSDAQILRWWIPQPLQPGKTNK